MTPIVPKRFFGSGITSFDAPFWRGDTAEALVAFRKRKRAEEKMSRRSTGWARAPESPERRLRRLERALPKRKLPETRARLQAEIETLSKQLGRR